MEGDVLGRTKRWQSPQKLKVPCNVSLLENLKEDQKEVSACMASGGLENDENMTCM